MEKNLTALMCAFIRTYYERNNLGTSKNDILSSEEFNKISESLVAGVKFFNPTFCGTKEEALDYIVYNHIGPSVLFRSKILENYYIMNKDNFDQYLSLAAGYDTSAKQFKGINPSLDVYELDREEVIIDKTKRYHSSSIKMIRADFRNNEWIETLYQNGFSTVKTSLCSLLGFSYYVDKMDFRNFLTNLNNIIAMNSVVIFDYQTNEETKITSNNSKLASGAKETMRSTFSDEEIKEIVKKSGYSIIEFLSNKDVDQKCQLFYQNKDKLGKIYSPKGVKYLIIKKTK